MTGLHPYVWGLYCDTPHGQAVLTHFDELPEKYPERAHYLDVLNGAAQVVNAAEGKSQEVTAMPPVFLAMVEGVKSFALERSASTPEKARQLLQDFVAPDGPSFTDEDGEFRFDSETALAFIDIISLGLHLAHPEVFVPYGFSGHHWIAEEMRHEFGTDLPPLPPKRDREARWLYFYDYSAAFQVFRTEHELTVAELLAFMNHFAPDYLSTLDSELPAPLNAWLLIGHPDEDGDRGLIDALAAEEDSPVTTHWQGNLNMQRGDVALMYLHSPLKQLYALCRVVHDGYLDPFFHYKQAVQVGRFRKVPPLSFAELASGPVMKGSGLIARRMQGASGALLSREEYGEIMTTLVARGLPTSAVPQLPTLPDIDTAHIQNERDVEVQLVEPLLTRLGLSEGDWVRQLPIRMGRGERNYPDYALGVMGQFPDQRARALVEVKHRTTHERDWREAFLQAKSYALRLQAKALLLASADGLRLYLRRSGDFQFETGEALGWPDLDDAKTLLNLRKALT